MSFDFYFPGDKGCWTFFMYLLAIFTSFENYLFSLLAHLLPVWFLGFLIFNCFEFFIIPSINLLSILYYSILLLVQDHPEHSFHLPRWLAELETVIAPASWVLRWGHTELNPQMTYFGKLLRVGSSYWMNVTWNPSNLSSLMQPSL